MRREGGSRDEEAERRAAHVWREQGRSFLAGLARCDDREGARRPRDGEKGGSFLAGGREQDSRSCAAVSASQGRSQA